MTQKFSATKQFYLLGKVSGSRVSDPELDVFVGNVCPPSVTFKGVRDEKNGMKRSAAHTGLNGRVRSQKRKEDESSLLLLKHPLFIRYSVLSDIV